MRWCSRAFPGSRCYRSSYSFRTFLPAWSRIPCRTCPESRVTSGPFSFSLVTIFTIHPTLGLGWVLCLALGLGIPRFAEITTPWLVTVSNRVATYTYGIYLSHQFSIWIAFGVLAERSLWLRVPVLIALLVALPVILYYAIERPMIQFGIHLANRWSEPRIEPIEAVAAT